MKQNFIVDYLSCALFKGASFFTSFLPLGVSLFFGRRLADLIYFFDRRHRAIAYANIRRTVADKADPAACARITRQTYRAFCQNLVEISFIPRINQEYLEKYIHIQNREYAQAAFARGKGVIFLIVHEGNWELSNIICANLGVPFVLFVRDQGLPRLNALLNSYRIKQGAKVIHKDVGIRDLIEVLKKNQAIGMTVDQGGRSGERVDFFGRSASMSTGAVKLALKHDCAIIPIYYRRMGGAHTQLILDGVFTAKRGGDWPADVRDNLQRLVGIYEKYLRRYPHEYLWTYKIYKYSLHRDLVIITDGKVGHLRQAQGLAKSVLRGLQERKIQTRIFTVQVKFRSRWRRIGLELLASLSGRYPGSGWGGRYLRYALSDASWQELARLNPDLIISAGSATGAVNYLLARESQAKSAVIMRPGNLSLRKFDLAVVARHDLKSIPWPARWNKKIVVTEGALNLIDEEYLQSSISGLKQSGLLKSKLLQPCIGVLIGGESKQFKLSPAAVSQLAQAVKQAAANLGMDILLTTSRRSSPQVEVSVKQAFADAEQCKLLVIANQSNHPDVVGGILGLSRLVICSPESISMISEAVAAGKYTVVFDQPGLSAKHRRFLRNFSRKGYIYLELVENLSARICRVLELCPPVKLPPDNLKVSAGVSRII